MAKKTYKAGTAANKIVRQIVQSLAPEHRKHLHEGLRVATKEHVQDALEEAFFAGVNGGCFSKD